MKHITPIFTSLFLLLFTMGCSVVAQEQAPGNIEIQNGNIYQFTVEDIYGDSISLSEYKGKKLLIVNTASKCGLTPQYAQLEELYEEFKDENFEILAFPANNFMRQEPGSNEQIAQFCKSTYGLTFPVMSKISVKGKDQHPMYALLNQKKYNNYSDNTVKWNFQKYLINEQGELEKVVSPKTLPNDPEIVEWIKKG